MAIYNGGLSIKNVSIGTATGSGNAITSLSADGNVITPDKGSTFLTAQDISGKEDKSNKVTAWSSATTDEHYPSEKLVKSALDDKANKSEIEASVTTNSLTAEAILPKDGAASIGADGRLFDSIYVNNARAITLSASEIAGLVHAPLLGLCNRSLSDWNDATSTGFYAMKSAANAPGGEVWYFGQVISFGDAGWLLQTAYPFTNQASLKTRPTFQRSMYDGNWSSWEEINTNKYGAVFN